MVDVRAEIAELKKRVDDVEREGRANAGSLAVAIRKTRLQLVSAELRQSVQKLDPPTSLLGWTPRAGDIARPAIDDSLIDRLRKGEQVSGTLGNTEPVIGQTNLLRNPLLEGFGGGSIGAVEAVVGPQWSGHYVLNSGTAPAGGGFVDDLYLRGDPNNNPLNSAIVGITAVATTNTYDIDLYVYPTTSYTNNPDAALPYLVASGRVAGYSGVTSSAFSTARVRIEIWDETTATVVAASEWLPFSEVEDPPTIRQLVAALGGMPLGSYSWQIRVNLVKTGALNVGGGIYFGEPQLHYAYSPDPIPFAPAIGSWVPREVAYQQSAEANPRMSLSSDGLKLGDGASPQDVWLIRSDAETLTIADGSLGELSGGLRVPGKIASIRGATTDAALEARVTGDVAERRFVVRANGQLEWGSGAAVADVNLFRAGVDVLRTNDTISSMRGAAADLAFQGVVTGDSVGRLNVRADGRMDWSSGAAAADVNLYRSAANILKTDDELQATGFVRILEGSSVNEGGELVLEGQGANADWSFDNFTGRLRWHSGGTAYMDLTTARLAVLAGDKIVFGAAEDTNLYRNAANSLITDDSLTVLGDIIAGIRIFAGGYVDGVEIAAPAAPAANGWRLYGRDNGAGKTQLVVAFNTGAVQVLATEP